MESICDLPLHENDLPVTNGCNTLPLPVANPDSQTTALMRHSFHGGSTL